MVGDEEGRRRGFGDVRRQAGRRGGRLSDNGATKYWKPKKERRDSRVDVVQQVKRRGETNWTNSVAFGFSLLRAKTRATHTSSAATAGNSQ